MPTELDLLRSLDDEPDTPSTVDIRKAMNAGRRRRVRRSAGYAGAAALTAIAVTGTSVTINLSAPGRTVPQPAASRAPRPSAGAPAAPAKVSPVSCTVSRLRPPDQAPQALVSAADPTGRYIVGRSYPRSGGYQAVIWADGRGREVMLPGDLEESLTGVNSSGTAVGWSYQGAGEKAGPVPYAYTGGKVVRMRGPEHAEPRAVNNAGVVIGHTQTGGRVDQGAGLMWPSPTAEPVPLPVPPGTKLTRPNDIAEDGTIVGGLDFAKPVMWTPDGELHELPMPLLDGKQPATVAQAFEIRDGWATGMAGTSPLRTARADTRVYAVRWNLRDGHVEVIKQLREPADDINAHGWLVGTDLDGYAALVTGDRTIRLPDLGRHRSDGTATIASTISDDGHLIAGQSDNSKGVIQAALWRCR
ncbi:hypothetical protein [Actinoplanes sp. NPDC049265]|uniref:hypothetical protein n=1 Tax=Actinoplanes sp. NPDC049265 TaxID=3363902 RepID=UPI003717A028